MEKELLDENIEVKISAEADDAELLAEYTRMVLGDNIDFFDQDFDKEDDSEFKAEIDPLEVFDEEEEESGSEDELESEEDDDMSDEDFFEAFGKAMKDKHESCESDNCDDSEILDEANKISKWFKNKADQFAYKHKDFSLDKGVDKFGVIMRKKGADGKYISDGNKITDSLKDAIAIAKNYSTTPNQYAVVQVAKLNDRYANIFVKYNTIGKKLSVDPMNPATWLGLEIYLAGELNKDSKQAVIDEVNACVDKYIEVKNAEKANARAEEVDAPAEEPAVEEPAAPVPAEEPVPAAEVSADPASAAEEPKEEEKPAEEPAPAAEEPKAEEEAPAEDTSEPAPAEEVPADEPVSSSKVDKANAAKEKNNKIINALKNAGINVDELTTTITDKLGRAHKKATDKLKALRKELFGESLEEDFEELDLDEE